MPRTSRIAVTAACRCTSIANMAHCQRRASANVQIASISVKGQGYAMTARPLYPPRAGPKKSTQV
jgi:hypothetical protein